MGGALLGVLRKNPFPGDNNQKTKDNQHEMEKERRRREKERLKHLDMETLEMVYPWIRVTARLVPEQDEILCSKPANYYLVFCNKSAWVTRRNVYVHVSVTEAAKKNRENTESSLKPFLERTFSV